MGAFTNQDLPGVCRRRRSSSYRPRYGYPQVPSIDSASAMHVFEEQPRSARITDLPTTVLLEICSHLSTADLLSVSLGCKLLYLPAAIELYRKVVVHDDLTYIQSIKACTKLAQRNLGTLIHSSKLESLVSVALSNHKLGGMIKTLCFLGNNYSIHGDAFYQMLLISDVRALVVPQLAVDPTLLSRSIQTLCIAVENIQPTSIHLPNLEHLKVTYTNQVSNATRFSTMAYALGEAGSLSSIRTLEFSEAKEEEDKLGLLNSLNNMNISQSNAEPSWLSFFSTLNGVCKLELMALGLDGHIGNNGCKLAELLSGTIRAELLECLDIQLTESTHPHSSHESQGESTTFVDKFTQWTPNLRSLGINPTYDCLFCQFDAMAQTLSNLQDKLCDLHLSIESLSLEYICKLDFCIVTHQPNLRTLRLKDKSRQVSDETTLLKCMNGNKERFSYYDYGSFYQKYVDETLFSDVFLHSISSLRNRENSVVNDYKIRFIEKAYQHGLNEFMKYYLTIGYSPFIVSGFDLVKKMSRLEYLETVCVGLVLSHRGRRTEVYYETNDQHIKLH